MNGNLGGSERSGLLGGMVTGEIVHKEEQQLAYLVGDTRRVPHSGVFAELNQILDLKSGESDIERRERLEGLAAQVIIRRLTGDSSAEDGTLETVLGSIFPDATEAVRIGWSISAIARIAERRNKAAR